MSNDDLWGDLPEADNTTEPAALLRQQASLLGSKTGNVLEGVVARPQMRNVPGLVRAIEQLAEQEGASQREKTVELRFSIRCPALDNYTFHVLTLKHPLLAVFPVSIHDEATGQNHVCQSEEELRAALHRVFTSQQLRRVISALLREARSLVS